MTAATLVALGTAVPAAAPAATCADVDRIPSATTEDQARAAVLCLLDAARAQRKVAPLHSELHIRRAAQGFAAWMDPAKPLTHNGHGGKPDDRLAIAGYAHGNRKAFDAGEAIGRSIGDAATPDERVSEWLADPQTRKVLLASRFRDAGVGVEVAGGKVTFVVDLAAPHDDGSSSSSS